MKLSEIPWWIYAREMFSIIEVVKYFKVKITRNLINSNTWDMEYYLLVYKLENKLFVYLSLGGIEFSISNGGLYFIEMKSK